MKAQILGWFAAVLLVIGVGAAGVAMAKHEAGGAGAAHTEQMRDAVRGDAPARAERAERSEREMERRRDDDGDAERVREREEAGERERDDDDGGRRHRGRDH